MIRRILAALLSLVLLTGCMGENSNQDIEQKKGIWEGKSDAGVWISYSELDGMLKSETGFLNELAAVIADCKELKIDNAYIHVRPFCDSIYPSEYYPLRESVKGCEFDVLELLISEFHKENIKVHAWLNPYRVRTASSDINALDNGSPAYLWLNDGDEANDRNVCFANGIYLNPAENEVQQLVIDGIREILSKYAVDGIHFDDYFYPTAEQDFDKTSYDLYCKSTENPLSLSDWRRANVNALISGCYTVIKAINESVVFSISPAASVENNYSTLFADVEHWVESGYIDAIIPQLYFGFEYPIADFDFEVLANVWKEIARKNGKVRLIIGLAPYKIGTTAEPDCTEWQQDSDILARQVKYCTDDDIISGYVYFSYSSLFSDASLNTAQREEIKNYINRG